IERRAHLYDAYIARMFSRKPLTGTGYTAAQALRWLRFLAARLIERDETQFFIEDLQPDWMPRKGRYLGPILPVLKPVDEFPIILEPRLQLQIIMDRWPLLGLIVVLGGYLGFQLGNKISYVLIGILVSIGVTLWIGFMTRMLLEWRGRTLSFFSSVTYNGKSREKSRYYKSVGQGIRRSSQNAILIVAVGGIITVPLFFMFLGVLESVINSTGNFRIVVAVTIGLFYWVIIFGLTSGGLFVLMHYILRLLLALHHLLPLRLVPFLEAMRERILMQRAGGHYRFIHRTLQEHIAALTDDRIERLT
ncbi:MAG TPA: hypothetical protein PLR07_13425, partial [Promineifilum sp.]|nr:hypothetical protein [Promineifilum sp.]